MATPPTIQQWRNFDNVENGGARLELLGTMTTVSEGETISNVKTVAMMMMPLTMMIAEVEEVKKSHPFDKEGCFEISLYV